MTKGPNQIAEEVKQSWTRWTMILDLLSHTVWNLQKKSLIQHGERSELHSYFLTKPYYGQFSQFWKNFKWDILGDF